MAKRFVYLCALLLALCLITSKAYAQAEDEDFEDLFEEAPEDAPEIFDETPDEEPQIEFEQPEIITDNEVEEMPAPEIIVETDPVPDFETATEKYIYYARKYMVELCLGSLFFVYILNIYVGQKVNSKVVAMWTAEALPVIQKNFHHTGFGDEPNFSISQLKYHEFEFFASGRDYCHYIFIHMITKKRQDIIGGSIAGLIWPDRDRVIFDIPIDVDIPLEIMICRKKDVKKTQEEMPNINKLIGPIPTKSFSNTQLTVLADSPESIEIVFPKRFASAFEKYEKHLEFLHVTDQRVYTNYPLVLKCEILMGEHPSEFADSVKLLEVIIDLVDHIAKPIKLPSKVLEKSKKLREVEEKKREKAQRDKRQQEIEEKREQREREEREKLKQMTPAEKQKYKEKIQKQERKKQMKGRNKVMKF